MNSKVILGAIAAVGVAASILAHPVSSRASDAPISARVIFDETLGSRIAQSLPAREGTKRIRLIAAVENRIAAHDPAFFNRFGDDMTSGDPHRVSSALSRASALLGSGPRVALRPDASVIDTWAVIGFVDDDSSLAVEGDYFVAWHPSDSAFTHERVASTLARRYAGRLAPS